MNKKNKLNLVNKYKQISPKMIFFKKVKSVI